MGKLNAGSLLVIAFATFIAVLLTGVPRPAQTEEATPAREFSAGQAFQHVVGLLEGTGPHPSGSADGSVVRERIAGAFLALGYETEFEQAFVCNQHGVCANVVNIVAYRRGRTGGNGIFLTSHYDSVPASLGAADDISGVAVSLEIARAISHESFRNPVYFLITDGEEGGLLGAEAFAEKSRWFQKASVFVNLEARGTSGPSFLFETSDDNAWLISSLAGVLSHPSTSSLFYTVYKWLPNDTDLSVFKRRGRNGVNFGFMGSAALYHTPLDEPVNLSIETLQHHGDCALATVRTLASLDVANPPAGNAVWFSVLNSFIVWWPEPWTLPFALTLLLGTAVAAALLLKRKELTSAGIWYGLLWLPAALLSSFLLGAAGSKLMSLRFSSPSWIAYPMPAVIFFWASALVATQATAILLVKRGGTISLRFGTAVWLGALSLAADAFAPGLSFLVLIPGFAVFLTLLPPGDSPVARVLLTGLATVAAGLVLFPVAWFLYEALGLPMMVAVSLLVALAGSVFIPAVSESRAWGRGVLAVSTLTAILSLITALVLPARNDRTPGQLNIICLSGENAPQWLVPSNALEMAPGLAASAQWRLLTPSPFPWASRAKFLSSRAPASRNVPGPRIELTAEETQGNSRRLSVRLQSPRKALRVQIAFHTSKIESIRVDGYPLDPKALTRNGETGPWTILRHLTLPEEGTIVEVALPKSEKLAGFAADGTAGLPPGGEVLEKARGPAATPSDDGDRTIALTRFEF